MSLSASLHPLDTHNGRKGREEHGALTGVIDDGLHGQLVPFEHCLGLLAPHFGGRPSALLCTIQALQVVNPALYQARKPRLRLTPLLCRPHVNNYVLFQYLIGRGLNISSDRVKEGGVRRRPGVCSHVRDGGKAVGGCALCGVLEHGIGSEPVWKGARCHHDVELMGADAPGSEQGIEMKDCSCADHNKNTSYCNFVYIAPVQVRSRFSRLVVCRRSLWLM